MHSLSTRGKSLKAVEIQIYITMEVCRDIHTISRETENSFKRRVSREGMMRDTVDVEERNQTKTHWIDDDRRNKSPQMFRIHQ